ncbi:MAG: 50S ribosomal protein L10 [Candidatus Dojkabacteria bacterium]|nr:50S ribosomal protein L10 [Candidatus Dojkabacteria bacterium]
MAITKQEKKKLLDTYVKNLTEARAAFVITPTQLTPNEATKLRKRLNDSSLNFVKNTLFRLAVKDTKSDFGEIDFRDQKAILFCRGDASEAAKILYEYLKEIKKGEIVGGFLDSTPLSNLDIEELATLPSKDIMLAITVGSIGAPLTGFVRVMNGTLTNFVNVIKNISENKS